MLTSAQMEDSDHPVDDGFLKEVVPTKGRGGRYQTVTLPTADMPSSRGEGHTVQELENVEVGATMHPAELAPQGSRPQMLLLSDTPTPTSQVSPSVPMPTIYPELPIPTASRTVPIGVTPIQSPVSLPYNLLQANRTLNHSKGTSR